MNGEKKIIFQSYIVEDSERRPNSSDKAISLPSVTEA